jgi:hypothetical protein
MEITADLITHYWEGRDPSTDKFTKHEYQSFEFKFIFEGFETIINFPKPFDYTIYEWLALYNAIKNKKLYLLGSYSGHCIRSVDKTIIIGDLHSVSGTVTLSSKCYRNAFLNCLKTFLENDKLWNS